MSQARKVIITCAVTGAIHTPSMSPHLPITAMYLAQQRCNARVTRARYLGRESLIELHLDGAGLLPRVLVHSALGLIGLLGGDAERAHGILSAGAGLPGGGDAVRRRDPAAAGPPDLRRGRSGPLRRGAEAGPGAGRQPATWC